MPPGPGGAPTDQVTSVGSETGVNTMLTDLEEHIYASGIADMVESADVITQDSEKYVERLLTLFRRFSAIVAEAFSDDPRYVLKQALTFQRRGTLTTFLIRLALLVLHGYGHYTKRCRQIFGLYINNCYASVSSPKNWG